MWLRNIRIILTAFLLISDISEQVNETVKPNGASLSLQLTTLELANKGLLELANKGLLECINPFIAVGDQCLYFVTYAEQNQTNSQLICQSLGGNLVVIQRATQLKNILDFFYNNGLPRTTYWIDGSDSVEEGVWQFSSGISMPMGTPFWRAVDYGIQEPNDFNGEDCVALAHLLNDHICSSNFYSICEQSVQNLHITSETSSAYVECPPLYVSVGDTCLAFVLWAEVTWVDARQMCQSISGELAKINNIELLRSIYLYLHEQEIDLHSFWLGGSDDAAEGVWTWLDNEPIPIWGPPLWGYGDPNGDEDENCLAINAEGYHYMRDKNCSLPMNPLCMLGPAYNLLD